MAVLENARATYDTEDGTTFEHPVVRTHPETGRKALFVNALLTVGLKNMTEDESRPILGFLFRPPARPAFTCRFRWDKGAVALWANRSVPPFALTDYPGQRRVMHRTVFAVDRPFLGTAPA